MAVDTSAPLVTVITATFNSSRTLQFTLHSLLNQDFQAFEAWVVGDACTDESETVVTSFGDRRLHWNGVPEDMVVWRRGPGEVRHHVQIQGRGRGGRELAHQVGATVEAGLRTAFRAIP